MSQQSSTVKAKSAIPTVTIIVLNWNGWKNTVECLESISQINYPLYEVILVDNGSKDNSVQQIQTYAAGKLMVKSKFFQYSQINKPLSLISATNASPSFGGEIFLVQNSTNLGFSAGTNIGLNLAQKHKADYVLLLNNDIVVEKDFLNALVEQAEKEPQIGIAGPTIYHYDRPDTVDFAGENLTVWRVKGKEFTVLSKQPREVDKIEGSCMLIRRAVLDKIGLLYTKYWAYWEETDLCFRAMKAGFKVVYVPDSIIWHKVAQSIGGEGNLRREYYLNRNRLLFARRNLNWGDQAKFLLYFFGFELWLKTAVELKHHSKQGAFMWLKAAFDGFHMYLDPANAP